MQRRSIHLTLSSKTMSEFIEVACAILRRDQFYHQQSKILYRIIENFIKHWDRWPKLDICQNKADTGQDVLIQILPETLELIDYYKTKTKTNPKLPVLIPAIIEWHYNNLKAIMDGKL